MGKSDYRLQKMVHKFLYGDKELKKEIEKGLEKVKKERNKKPSPKITRLVDRKDPWFTPSYHEEMQELARQEKVREEYLPDDVEHV